MKEQKKLSPKKYIETKARTLPVYKCWINPDWNEAGMANVVVSRIHVSGNLTAGVYLVDLMCLGIKETIYFFNQPKEDLEKKLGIEQWAFTEVDYNLAHNIVYAGHDFAADYDILPHKEFATTKFILDDDTEAIPLLDVPTGDEEGKPRLIVASDYNYRPALQKLIKNAGEGNYSFIINDFDGEDEEDSEDEDDFSEDEMQTELDDIEIDYIDFNDTRNASDDELQEAYNSGTRSVADEKIIYVETMMRLVNETDPGWIRDEDVIFASEDFKLFEAKTGLHLQIFNEHEKHISQLVAEINSIVSVTTIDSGQDAAYFKLFEKYAQQEFLSFMVLNAMPLITLITNLEHLQNKLNEYPPLVQLTIAALSLALQQKSVDSHFNFITDASVAEEAFPGYKLIHAMHHKIFWVVKALHAMNTDNTEQIKHYHSLLSITSIGGKLKFAYAIRFGDWLEKR